MTIKVGDTLPAGTLSEFIEVEGNGCTHRPERIQGRRPRQGQEGRDLRACPARSRRPARPSTCRATSHNRDQLKAKGVDDVICMSVNDAFVMGAWARDQKAGGKVRMMGDGSADYTKALGLELDLDARGMGMRCQRFSMLVDNGVVKTLNIEAPGQVRSLGRRHDAEAARLTAPLRAFAPRKSGGSRPPFCAARLRVRYRSFARIPSS